jgi:NADH pyrophosphatase NudC (nudix superfamily)
VSEQQERISKIRKYAEPCAKDSRTYADLVWLCDEVERLQRTIDGFLGGEDSDETFYAAVAKCILQAIEYKGYCPECGSQIEQKHKEWCLLSAYLTAKAEEEKDNTY